MDSYRNLFKEALYHSGKCRFPKLSKLLKFLVLRPSIFGDLEVQYVMKRGLYIHECTERGILEQESMVILGKEDELLHDPEAVGTWLESHWPKAHLHTLD